MIIPLSAGNADRVFFEFNSYTGQADNIFNYYLGENQNYSNGALTLYYQPASDIRIFGNIQRNVVVSNNDFSSGSARLGIQSRYLEIQNNQIFTGLNIHLNSFSPVYEYYNSNGISGYINWKIFRSQQRIYSLGYNLDRNLYSNLSVANNNTHTINGKIHLSSNAGIGMNLTAWYAVQDFIPGDSLNDNEISSNVLTGGEIKLSKSISPRIGLVMEAGGQVRLNRFSEDALYNDYISSPFIDNFRYKGVFASGGINLRLKDGLIINALAYYKYKEFEDVPVYEYDFSTAGYLQVDGDYVLQAGNRLDEYQYFQIRLSRDWDHLLIIPRVPSISTSLSLSWKNNLSNDPIYTYSGWGIVFGLHIAN